MKEILKAVGYKGLVLSVTLLEIVAGCVGSIIYEDIRDSYRKVIEEECKWYNLINQLEYPTRGIT